jgi:plasmid stability protein
VSDRRAALEPLFDALFVPDEQPQFRLDRSRRPACRLDGKMLWWHIDTMPGLHIRDLPEATLKALKRRAGAHHRSVQGELRAILEEAARAAPPEGGYPPIRLHQVAIGGRRPWTRADFYDDER